MVRPQVHCVLFALFDGTGRLDRAAMQSQIRAVHRMGADGIVVNGLATEVGKLTQEERLALIAWTAEDRGPLPLAVTLAGTVGDQITAGRAAAAAGADLVILQPPPDRTTELLDAFATIGAALDLPLAVQNAPQYLGRSLTEADLTRLRERLPHLTHVKAEIPAVDLAAFLAGVGPDLAVLTGRGGLEMTDCLRAGCAGFVVAPDVLPGVIACRDAWAAGNEALSEAAYAGFLPAAVFGMQSLEHLACYGKRIFGLRERIEIHDREPALKPTDFGLTLARRWSAVAT